jgi:hypothetical protein
MCRIFADDMGEVTLSDNQLHEFESMALSRRRRKGKSLTGQAEEERNLVHAYGHQGQPKNGMDRFASRFGDFARTS